MVMYHVDLAKPGLATDVLCQTFSGAFNIVNIFVGNERELFQLPKLHICTIPYFAKAFNGEFKEGISGSIDLLEDDPTVFKIFVRWLYRGLDSDALNDVKVACIRWTKFFLMADKWCLPQLAKELFKHISNSLPRITTKEVAPYDDGEIRHGGGWALFKCAELTEGHPIQYLFAHDLYQRQSASWTATLITKRNRHPSFIVRCLLWSTVMLKCDRTNSYLYTRDKRATEAKAHKIDRLILPLLFEDEPFPDVFVRMHAVCPEKGGIRAFLREELDL